ncbi:cyclin-D1-binding protein 1 homolog [Syngnathus scovelli]|uniref:cyclin-D1-binding protein 1 homolog n=1 Tax=Syngnathus scovelli TaxID=161590 RepID=UPI0035CBF01F
MGNAVEQRTRRQKRYLRKPPNSAWPSPSLPCRHSKLDVGQLADSVLKSVLSLSTVYYWLPNSRGVTLRQQVRDAVVQALEGLTQLLEVILTSPLQSLTQEQLTSTGVCGQHVTASPAYHMLLAHLLFYIPFKQNKKAAAVLVLSGKSGIVKDAIEELEQALSEARDPSGDAPDQQEDGEEPHANQDAYWSVRDRRVVAACQGMMKVTAACLRKTIAAVRIRGDADEPQRVGQLDRLLDGIKEISPGFACKLTNAQTDQRTNTHAHTPPIYLEEYLPSHAHIWEGYIYYCLECNNTQAWQRHPSEEEKCFSQDRFLVFTRQVVIKDYNTPPPHTHTRTQTSIHLFSEPLFPTGVVGVLDPSAIVISCSLC